MKKVLVVAYSYPSKENPIGGSFFKEQIDFLSSEIDFTVVVYREKLNRLFFSKLKSCDMYCDNSKINQYYPIVYISICRKIIEFISGFIKKNKNAQSAVGIYRSKYYRKYRKKIISRVDKIINYDYDAVYCMSAQESACAALMFSEIKNKPLVISEHRPYPHPGWSTVDIEKEAFEKADFFLAICKDKIRQIMLQNIKPKRIAYVGNLIDEDVFTISPTKHEYPTLLIVAAYVYFKDYNTFIDSMEKLLKKAKREFRIIIAGYGANKGYYGDIESFENRIKESPISSITEMIRMVSRDSICALYNRADAFVLTSIQEGQPMVALEAACCGLPIFSTRCGGVEDYVTDEIGRLVDVADSDSLSEYLLEYLEKKIVFNSEKIRNEVIKRYGKSVFMNKMMGIFDSLE